MRKFGLLLTSLIIFGCKSNREEVRSKDHPIVVAFSKAKSIKPHWSRNGSLQTCEWDDKLELANGLSIKIVAVGSVGGKFVGQYSDESETRLVGDPGDYVYPCDLRVNADSSRIFAKASGLAGGIQQVTTVFEFDTKNRMIIHRYHVDPKWLGEDTKPPSVSP